MVSLTSPTHICFSHLNIRSIYVVLKAKKGAGIRRKAAGFKIFVGKSSDFFGFLEVGRGKSWENSWGRWCKGSWESEGYSDLEAEILDFMENSSKPGAFPSEKELVEAGRLDLVEAIKSRGGWLSLGWVSEEGNEGERVKEDEILRMEFDIKDFQRRLESCKKSGSLKEIEPDSWPSSSARNSNTSGDSSASSNNSASSSGRSLEIGFEEDSGIDGILSRLEKERSSSFGIDLRISKYRIHTSNKGPRDDRHFATSRDVAAEIPYGENRVENRGESLKDEIIVTASDAAEALGKWKETICNKHIQTRLQHLELEIASALHSLRSKSEEIKSKEVLANSCSDLHTLSVALEFQEIEFMSSRERLRSIRAKLAVLEGKLGLAIMDAQKILEEKQMRIDSACKTLELLCTAYIIWPNSASEVLLAGSFDGWTTQRKMEKSRTGIFSVCLKLYPGKYEIKFIVDGQWKIDPLRPVVHNNGYENNLLMIT